MAGPKSPGLTRGSDPTIRSGPMPPGMAGSSPAMTRDGWRAKARHDYLELGNPRLLRGDELQQCRLAFLRLFDAALDRRLDLVRIRHALAVAAERRRHVGVVAGDVGGRVLLGGHRHHLQLD